MTTPPTKPAADLALPDDDESPGEQSSAGWPDDAWFERNKDVLNASIRQAREDFARGKFLTHEEVWTRLRAKINALKD